MGRCGMPNRKLYVFCVRGRTNFPIDMLRYDRATPHTEGDSCVIKCAVQVHSHYIEDVDIELQSHSLPTDARWRSFGWEIVQIQEIKIPQSNVSGW
jgi:hypothetical protein